MDTEDDTFVEELKYQPPTQDSLNRGIASVNSTNEASPKSPNQSHMTVPQSSQYISLHNINHSTEPKLRNRQKSRNSIYTDVSRFTRLSSVRSKQASNLSNTTVKSTHYTAVASVISAYSSFIPQENRDLLQIEYTFDQETKASKQTRIIYLTNLILFALFYILLLFPETAPIARYLILIVSLSLSLTYTMKPSYFNIPLPCLCHNIGAVDAESHNKSNTEATFHVTVRKIQFPLDQSTVPIICVLLLIANWADTYFTFAIAWNSIKGDPHGIQPWAVLGLLFGLCYLCITLDLTGILKGLAKKTADSSDSYQTRLFLYIFLFAAALTAITNNDISIICLTPLVCSTANSGNLDATPYIFMVLFTSNTFSMLLITGNPANLIVSQAAGLPYALYFQYMAVPTLVTGVVLYAELYIMFRKSLRKRFYDNTNITEAISSWKDLIKLPRYAIFCTIRLFIACFGIPIVGQLKEHNPDLEQYPLDMFIVLGIAVVSLVIDLMAFDIRVLADFASTDYTTDYDESLLKHYNPHWREEQLQLQQQKLDSGKQRSLNAIDETAQETRSGYNVEFTEMSGIKSFDPSETGKTNMDMYKTVDTRVTHSAETYDSNRVLYDKLKLKIEYFAVDALWELPWKLIPFVFGLFVIVGFMKEIGLVDALAGMLLKVAINEWLVMFVVGFIATVLCQMVNNQGMTVLISAVLIAAKEKYIEEDPIRNKDGPTWLTGAYFALAIGANLGGNATPIASLAVLMWRGILEKWSIQMQYFGFSKRGVAVTPILVAVCILIVALEEIYLF